MTIVTFLKQKQSPHLLQNLAPVINKPRIFAYISISLFPPCPEKSFLYVLNQYAKWWWITLRVVSALLSKKMCLDAARRQLCVCVYESQNSSHVTNYSGTAYCISNVTSMHGGWRALLTWRKFLKLMWCCATVHSVHLPSSFHKHVRTCFREASSLLN